MQWKKMYMARENVFVLKNLNIGTRSEKGSPPLAYQLKYTEIFTSLEYSSSQWTVFAAHTLCCIFTVQQTFK